MPAKDIISLCGMYRVNDEFDFVQLDRLVPKNVYSAITDEYSGSGYIIHFLDKEKIPEANIFLIKLLLEKYLPDDIGEIFTRRC